MKLGITLAVVVGLSVGCAAPQEDPPVGVAVDGVDATDLPDYGFTSLTFGADDVVVAKLADPRIAPDTLTLVGTTMKGVTVQTSIKLAELDAAKGIARYVSAGGAPIHDYNDVVAEGTPTPSPKWIIITTSNWTNLDAINNCEGRKPPTPPNCTSLVNCVMTPLPSGCTWY